MKPRYEMMTGITPTKCSWYLRIFSWKAPSESSGCLQKATFNTHSSLSDMNTMSGFSPSICPLLTLDVFGCFLALMFFSKYLTIISCLLIKKPLCYGHVTMCESSFICFWQRLHLDSPIISLKSCSSNLNLIKWLSSSSCHLILLSLIAIPISCFSSLNSEISLTGPSLSSFSCLKI